MLFSCGFLVKYDLLFAPGYHVPLSVVKAMVPSTFLNFAGMLLMMVAMARGPTGITWAVGQSALVVPFAGSILFGHEQLRAGGLLGLVLILAMIAVLGWGQKNQSGGVQKKGWKLVLAACFMAIGLSQMGFTATSWGTVWEDTARIRTPFMALLTFVFSTGLLLPKLPRFEKSIFWLGAASGLIMAVSEFCLFRSMDFFKPLGFVAIVFPTAIGVCIIAYTVYSMLWRRERLKWYEAAILLTGIAGMWLMSLNS